MTKPILRQARQMGLSIYRLVNRSESPTTKLSSGALASIAIAGSVVFFLIIAPLLIRLAKRRGRGHRSQGSITSLSSVEHGQLAQDENFNGPRRLRKRSVVSDGVMYFGTKHAEAVGGGRGGSGRVARHLSLPILPPVFSRPGSFGVGDLFSGIGSENGGGERNHNGVDSGANGEQTYGSPEKRRGHAIYQNRRRTSWIDEDALHGPRISTKKDTKKKSSWVPGRGLTRTLSRHLSIRRFYAPELDRSPTLPYIETGPSLDMADGASRKSHESRKTIYTENPRRSREMKTEPQTEPRFTIEQPFPYQQGGPPNNPIPRVHNRGSGPQRASVPGAVPPSSRYHNNRSDDAPQQLPSRARVPNFDRGVNGQQPSYSRSQQSNTDAELQAILRRTAERLEDGNRSARRQTMMVPASSSSSTRLLDQTRRGPDQGNWSGKDYAHAGSAVTSPAKSQKSAPAVMLYSEPEGGNPGIQQQGPSQNRAPWQTHRRTHSREISHIPQISRVSMLAEPDNLVATPTKHRSQVDMLHVTLPSPSRSIHTPPSHTQQDLIPRSYSPASEQSSALSTVYSEEEDGLPTSVPQLESVPGGASEISGRVMAQALQTSDAFYSRQVQGNDDAEAVEGRRELYENVQPSSGPRSFHKRHRTLERIYPNGTQTAASSPSGGIKQPTARFSPQGMSIIQNLQTETEDPFTTSTTPKQLTPQRLSKLFSPLPTKLQGDTTNSAEDTAEPYSGTPTPSPSRRVVPPPHRLRPGANSPTLGHYHDAQFQIQAPSRQGSPVESEGGLSSVYDSYRYSRRYSDSVEGSQALARLSATTMLTVPPAEGSPTKSTWNQTPLPIIATEHHTDDREMRSTHVRLNNALSGTGTYTHFANPLELSTMENGAVGMVYTVEDALPRSQPHRDITCSTVSESTYSQDEGGDRLAPLMPIYSNTTAAPGKHTSRVMNTVVELRRMNSQVSCVSSYSTATTNITSPTLPELRGGGCSPGKKGTVGAAKNYFSLGSTSPSSNRESEYSYEESRRLDARSEKDDEAQNETTMAPVEISKNTRDAYTLRRGGSRRSRRNTVVEGYEQDLDRARQILRQSRGYNLQSIREVSSNVGSGDLMTQVIE